MRDSINQREMPAESVNCNVCGLFSSTVPSGKNRIAGKLLNVAGVPKPTFSTAICNVESTVKFSAFGSPVWPVVSAASP